MPLLQLVTYSTPAVLEESTMRNLRTYGRPPLGIAVIHGGPGAGGEMAPVARELQADWGVLEPLQTKTTLERHVSELKAVLETSADLPAVLIGFSWGAWLSFIVAARYPSLVQKLVLVGSGPFEHKYLRDIGVTRLSRLSENERGSTNRSSGSWAVLIQRAKPQRSPASAR